MSWKIVNIQSDYCSTWSFEGFREDGRTLYVTIERTTYKDAEDNKKKYLGNYPDYNEGVALSYINKYEVYIINIEIDNNPDEVEKMKKNNYVFAKKLIYNGISYMGLPLSVFAHWKGIIELSINFLIFVCANK